MGPLSGKTSTMSKSSHAVIQYRLLTVLSCSSWFSDTDGERPRPTYLPARISGYDARQVPFPKEYEEQEEPAGLQHEEPTRMRQEEPAGEEEQPVLAAEGRTNPAEEVQPDELDERTVQLQLIDFTDGGEVEEPPEDDALDDAAGEDEPDEPAGQPPQEEPAEESLPAKFAEEETEGFEESEEWLAPADVAWGDEPDEEEPYYEYAAQYVEPFAGYRDLRGGDIRP